MNIAPVYRENLMSKKPKKTILKGRQVRNALHKALQNCEGKLPVFSSELTRLIETIPDVIMLEDKVGRKLITNQLTKPLLKQHDLDWYGKAQTKPTLKQKKNYISTVSLQSDIYFIFLKQQLKIHYQAQVDSGRKICGAEALLRWEHPQLGTIVAEQFISLAEQTGLILPIGAWVLQSACEQIKLWQIDPHKKKLSLSVNISSHQFNQAEFVEQLKLILNKTSINPELLILELTESSMLQDVANTICKMKELQKLGIMFSMDNFGTGYSSLGHLKALPLNQLKIAHFLMRDIVFDSCDAMIIKTIIDMTKKLGITMLAGGIETEQQFTCLKQLGCFAYQGNLFGKPMPLQAFEQLYRLSYVK